MTVNSTEPKNTAPQPLRAGVAAIPSEPARPSHERSLWIALSMTGTYLLAEVVGGLLTGSLALLSDAAHMLTDVAGLIISLTAVRLSRRKPDLRRTFGYHRVEILAAAVNAGMLFAAAIYILVEAVRRFRSPPEIQSMGMLIVASIGLAVNLASMAVLRSGQKESLNLRGAYLEVLGDMLGSIGVIAAAIVVRYTGWRVVDPIVAVGIGLFVLPRAWSLLRETANVLLEGVPAGMNIEKLRKDLADIPGLATSSPDDDGVHELHLWAIATGKPSLSVHLVAQDTTAGERAEPLLRAAQEVARRHGIEHVSVQIERSGYRSEESKAAPDQPRY